MMRIKPKSKVLSTERHENSVQEEYRSIYNNLLMIPSNVIKNIKKDTLKIKKTIEKAYKRSLSNPKLPSKELKTFQRSQSVQKARRPISPPKPNNQSKRLPKTKARYYKNNSLGFKHFMRQRANKLNAKAMFKKSHSTSHFTSEFGLKVEPVEPDESSVEYENEAENSLSTLPEDRFSLSETHHNSKSLLQRQNSMIKKFRMKNALLARGSVSSSLSIDQSVDPIPSFLTKTAISPKRASIRQTVTSLAKKSLNQLPVSILKQNKASLVLYQQNLKRLKNSLERHHNDHRRQIQSIIEQTTSNSNILVMTKPEISDLNRRKKRPFQQVYYLPNSKPLSQIRKETRKKLLIKHQEERKKHNEFKKIKQKFLANRVKLIGEKSFKEFFDQEKMLGVPKNFVKNQVIQKRLAEILTRKFIVKTYISRAKMMPNARHCKF